MSDRRDIGRQLAALPPGERAQKAWDRARGVISRVLLEAAAHLFDEPTPPGYFDAEPVQPDDTVETCFHCRAARPCWCGA